MSQFEYTVIPAPTRGEKVKDAKTPGARYAIALTSELNRMAREGWDYVRADVLPSEERSGLTGRSTVYHNLLVFRRSRTAPGDEQDTRSTHPAGARAAPFAAPSQPAGPAAQPDDPASGPVGAPAEQAAPPAPRPDP